MFWVGKDLLRSANATALKWAGMYSTLTNLTLSVCRDRTSATPPRNLVQCFTVLITEDFFLISSLNPPSFSPKPLLLATSYKHIINVLKGHNSVPLDSSPVSTTPILQAIPHKRGSIPLIVVVVLVCTLFDRSMSCLCCGPQNWMQLCR